MTRALVVYVVGLALLALIGFFSPVWYLGFLPLGFGALWASYDLINVEDARGDTAKPSR